MGKELKFLVEQIMREKGINKDAVIELLETALISAIRKKYGNKSSIKIKIDPQSFDINIFEIKKVVEQVTDPSSEISIEEAQKNYVDKGIGDTVEVPLSIQDFGRIAVQTAKHVLFQKIREIERSLIYEEFKDKVGNIVSGTVLRKEKGNFYILVGKAEAILPEKEILPQDNLKRGDLVKAYIYEVKQAIKEPVIKLSRTHPNFVIGLFNLEVPEIQDGIVEIKGIARDPGERTKIAVYSKDTSVDPVGACVGMKGTRVQAVVRELKGERIDIIPYSEDMSFFIAKALTPATVLKVGTNENEKTAVVVVENDQLSLAIGKKGQNVRLASRLTGWSIDVLSESEYTQMKFKETEESLKENSQKQKNE
ncbi:MAG TPA: transcription termination factor NusA [Thermodesulfovibrio thiophilus]|nr:transcription termination factor NusA [Thermodesulfovibrio thiophilus]